MRVHRRLVLLAALGASWLVLTAAPAAAATQLRVEPGWGGRYQPGDGIPVRVEVTADRLVRGELEVVVDDQGFASPPSVRLPVEVPGGSTKAYLVVVDSGADPPGVDVRVTLRAGDSTVADARARVEPARDTELVGLLPGALAGRPAPGTAPLAIDAGTAHFTAVEVADLTTPGALASLDVLAAAPGELADVGPGAAAAVLQWVAAGGHLVVDDLRGTEVAGLPDAWQPGEAGRARAGLGEVRAVDGAVAEGRWAGLFEPTPASRSGAENVFGGGEPIDATLARDAGLRIPEIGWLVGFLAAYVLLAVPLTLTLLRRSGRGELGWVVLPLVALGFTGAGYLAGRDIRQDTTAAHGTVLHLSEVGAQATTHVGVVANDGGTVATSFPATWRPVGSSNQWWGPRAAVVASPTNDGIELRQRLQPGEFGVRTARGPVALDGTLDVTATSEGDGRLSGMVRSTLPFDLDEVVVFQGASGTELGSLPAGGELRWELEVDGTDDPWMGPARTAWPEATGMDGMPDLDSVVAFPLWESYEARSPAGTRAPGSVLVAGWTRGFTPQVGGLPGALEGRTLVTTTAAVRPGAGITDVALRTLKVRTATASGGFDGAPLVLRHSIPATGRGDPPTLVVRAPRDGIDLEVWRAGAWEPLGPGEPPGDGAEPDRGGGFFGPVADRALPADVVEDGLVWVRASVGGPGNDVVDPAMLSVLDLVTLRRAA